jgi:hypothetical protein
MDTGEPPGRRRRPIRSANSGQYTPRSRGTLFLVLLPSSGVTTGFATAPGPEPSPES